MKKKRYIILIIIVFAILFSGCSYSNNKDSNPLGLELSVSNISNTGLKLICVQSGKNLIGEITTNVKYWIEKYDNDNWNELEYISSVHWDEISIITIPQNDEYYWTLYWPFYGELSSGHYRVKKRFNYNEKEYTYYAEFEIE